MDGSQGAPRKFVEKRRRKDWVTQSVTFFTLIGWCLAIMMLMLFSEAQPGKENFITRVLGISVPRTWDSQLLWLSLIMLLACFVFCAVGIIFNLLRHRRKTDRFSKPLILLCCASAIGIVAFLARFAVYL